MIGALLAGASVVSGLLGSRSASKAAKAQEQANQLAIEEQRRQFDATRSDLAPFRDAGVNALGQLANPQANFMASPGYQFRLNEGTRNVMGNRIASGTAKSGNALKALAEFGQGMASNEFGNWWNQQAGLAGAGQNATNALGQFGAQTAGNIAGLYQNSGEARASGVMGAANSISGALNSGLNNYLLYQGGYFGAPQAPPANRYPNGGIGGGIYRGQQN